MSIGIYLALIFRLHDSVPYLSYYLSSKFMNCSGYVKQVVSLDFISFQQTPTNSIHDC